MARGPFSRALRGGELEFGGWYLLDPKEERFEFDGYTCRAGFGLPSPRGRRAGNEGSPLSYRDVPGVCKVARIEQIAANSWSLNPGRCVGIAAGQTVSDEDFKQQLESLNEELETLNAAARALEATIASNVTEILET